MVKASFGLQLKLLYWKNWLFTKRTPVKTAIEIIIPVLLLIVLVGLRTLSTTETTPEVVYCSQATQPDDITRFYMAGVGDDKKTEAAGDSSRNLCDDMPLGISRFNTTSFTPPISYSVVAYAPDDNAMVDDIVSQFEASLQRLGTTVTTRSYPTVAALENAATIDSSIGIGIIFQQDSSGEPGSLGLSPNDVHYTLRVRQPEGFTEDLDTTILFPRFESIGPDLYLTDAYFGSTGFVTFQGLIDRAIVTTLSGSEPQVYSRLRPMSWPEYSEDPFTLTIRVFLPLVLLLSFISPVTGIVYGIVYEKENRLKEAMKMMGVSETIHWLAWFLKTFSYLIITVILLTVVFAAGNLMPNTDTGVIFFVFLLNMLATISFGFFLSTLFSKATLAAFVSGLLFYAAYMPYSFLQRDLDTLSNSEKAGLCLLSPSCVGLAADILSVFEGRGEGLRFDNLADNPTDVDMFSMADVFGMLILDCLLYLFLTWYISNVFPGDYGIPKPFYFFLTKSYWTGVYSPIEDHGRKSDVVEGVSYFEPIPSDASKGIEIKNLRKVFKAETGGAKVVIEDLSMDMLENQITALLGHNGAGKTTTLSMLVGLFPPTSGTAHVGGKDVQQDTEGVRASLGLCPQFNVLFELLTVAEHIMLFSRLKGLSVKEAEAEVEKYAKELDLENKANENAKTLSGGQKRALSVGIALCGDSKFVILDEPTSGMDVFKRRQTWNLLLQHKVGRTMVLTTHFMEEADLLGDRIAIMADGRLKTMGSSLFLKQRFGIGYHMTLVKKEGCSSDAVTRKIQEHVPGASLQTNVGTELSLVLPKEHTADFPKMFDMLDASKEELRISSYGVSATTMEEVFLKVAHGNLAQENDGKENGPSVIDVDGNDKPILEGKSTLLTGSKLLWLQVKAMFYKRAIYSLRNKWNLVTQIVLPLFFVLIALSLAALDERVSSNPSLRVDASTYGPQTVRLAHTDTAGDYFSGINNASVDLVASIASHNTTNKRTMYDNLRSYFDAQPEISLNLLGVDDVSASILDAAQDFQRTGFFRENLLALSIEQGPTHLAFNETSSTCGVLRSDGVVDVAPLMFQRNESYVFKFFANSSDDLYLSQSNTTKTGGFIITHQADPDVFVGAETGLVRDFTLTISDDFLATYGNQLYLFCGPNNNDVPLAMDFNAMTSTGAEATVVYAEYSPKAVHSPAVAQNVIANGMARTFLGPTATITTYNNPLPRSALQSVDDIQSNGFGFAVGLNMMFAVGFLAGSFVLFIVTERISKAKHIQFVSGVAPFTFWLASYVWDFVTVLPSAVGVIIIMAAYDVEAYHGTYGHVFLLYLLALLAAIPFVYLVSFAFKTPSSAYGTIAILGMFVGLVGILGTFLGTILDGEETGNIFRYVFLLLPNVALGQGIYDIWLNSQYRSLAEEFAQVCDMLDGNQNSLPASVVDSLSFCSLYKPNYFDWDEPGIGKIVVYTIFTAGFWFMILMLIEYGFLRFLRLKPFPTPTRSEDDDVSEERKRVEDNWASWQDKKGASTTPLSEKTNALSASAVVTTDIDDATATSHSSNVLDADFANNNNHVAVRDLTKLFKKGSSCKGNAKFTAVDHISFAVPQGQCFGLLGVNGAGKTTTFGMLTGDHEPSEGEIIAAGYNLRTHQTQARQHMGYCPQFDALIGLLTGREHIEMYAKIRGVPEEKAHDVTSTLINRLGLAKHADKPAYTYSGGNKRKLSTAIALVGSPEMVLLDEPTTGMDPEARRFLWSVLENVTASGQSIILTSHSMEECEALCHRLAIMVNGRLRCLGSPGHLKYKFGKGAKVQAKLKPNEDGTVDSTDALKSFLETSIHGMKLLEEYNGAVTYRVVGEETHTQWGYMFEILEKAREEFNLEDYGLSEVSLEEVFLRFAAEQHTDEKEREGVFVTVEN